MAGHGAVQVEGLDQLVRGLVRLGEKDVLAAIKAAHKRATDLVVPAAQAAAPKRSGRLAKSVKAVVSQRSASVKAGSPQRVPYAGIIHYGGMTSGKLHGRITANPFLERAIASRINEVRDAYEREMGVIVDGFNAG